MQTNHRFERGAGGRERTPAGRGPGQCYDHLNPNSAFFANECHANHRSIAFLANLRGFQVDSCQIWFRIDPSIIIVV